MSLGWHGCDNDKQQCETNYWTSPHDDEIFCVDCGFDDFSAGRRRAMRRRLQRLPRRDGARGAGRGRLARGHRPGLRRRDARTRRCSPSTAASAAPSAKSFEQYAATRVTAGRIKRAKQMMQRHAALLARIEQQFGVPPELVVAIWALETDNGAGDMGKLPVVRTLATLAHDCRRTELFQSELIAALQDPAARRPAAARSDRRLCRRDRADAVPAVVLHQVRRRLRRQRPCRSAPLACRTCSPRPPICSRPMAGRPASPSARARANFEVMREWNTAEALSPRPSGLFAHRLGG